MLETSDYNYLQIIIIDWCTADTVLPDEKSSLETRYSVRSDFPRVSAEHQPIYYIF